MTKLQIRLRNAYAILIMANRRTLEDVPVMTFTLEDGTESTLKQEVAIEIAEREVKALT